MNREPTNREMLAWVVVHGLFFATAIATGLAFLVLRLMRPDMAEGRLFLTYWTWIVPVGVVFLLDLVVTLWLTKRRR